MKFLETRLTDAFVVEVERLEDERGYFALNWSDRDFEAAGLDAKLVECNVSFNRNKGTLRGMHYQEAPHEQVKLVRCTRGAIYDVIIDLRPASTTFKQWLGVELTAENARMLYVPAGFAHGIQTLADNTESDAPAGERIRGSRGFKKTRSSLDRCDSFERPLASGRFA